MLVYANNLCFHGPDAEMAIFRAIGVWTKEQLGYGLRPDQHHEDGEYTGTRDGSPAWLRIRMTAEEEPQLYSWVLKVSDNSVRGRQWITELGLKIQDGNLFFSCVLRTDEQSTMVDDSVSPSQPRVVRYVVDNINKAQAAHFHGTVPGGAIRNVGDNLDSYRGLLADIENELRNYPIILISPDREGEFRINISHLQQIVVGLAQIVKVNPDYDSYDMENILGRNWSAWDGAVNLIHTITPAGFIRGRIFRTDEIINWGDTQNARISKLLAWVTNNTNIPRMRKRVRPEGVAQLALRRRIQLSRARTSQMDDVQLRQELESVWHLAEEQALQVEEYEAQISQLESEFEAKDIAYQEAQDVIRSRDYTIESLKGNLSKVNDGKTVDSSAGLLLDLLVQPGEPLPLECLNIIEELHEGSCIVLETAKDSARESQNFKQGKKLLKNLNILVTDYREKLIQFGDGDARTEFGRNEYAATESERVTSNPDMRRKRIFEYKGEQVEMFRHLKIGVDDDFTKTIRVHFYWDAQNKKIIIGHCGRHLPVSGH